MLKKCDNRAENTHKERYVETAVPALSPALVAVGRVGATRLPSRESLPNVLVATHSTEYFSAIVLCTNRMDW